MNTLAEKIAAIERDLAKTKGDFVLFGLFLREDAPDRWDVVIAAPWISDDKQAALREIAHAIQSKLKPNELIELSRIILVDPDDPSVRAINRAIGVEHGQTEVRDTHFFGMPIRHAIIITSKSVDPGIAA